MLFTNNWRMDLGKPSQQEGRDAPVKFSREEVRVPGLTGKVSNRPGNNAAAATMITGLGKL